MSEFNIQDEERGYFPSKCDMELAMLFAMEHIYNSVSASAEFGSEHQDYESHYVRAVGHTDARRIFTHLIIIFHLQIHNSHRHMSRDLSALLFGEIQKGAERFNSFMVSTFASGHSHST